MTVGRPPGGKKYGGRAKGTVNKDTREFRETVTALLQNNAENVQIWLSQVANGHGEVKADPGRALDLMAKLAEYAAPKLARTEHTGLDGGPMKQEQRIEVHIVDARE